MIPRPLVPAGFWRRYAAWSLDAVPAAILACLLTRAQLQAMGITLTTTAHGLVDHIAATMLRLFEQGSGVFLTALTLTLDPALRDGSRALAAALTQGLQWTALVFAGLMLLLHVAFEQGRWRGTPGKRLLDLVVTDVQGAPPSLPRSVLRNLAGLLSWLSFNLGHALAAIPPQHRALHDYVAGTQVLAPPARLPQWARAWLCAQAVLLLVAFACALTWMQGALDAALMRALG